MFCTQGQRLPKLGVGTGGGAAESPGRMQCGSSLWKGGSLRSDHGRDQATSDLFLPTSCG